MATIAPDYSKLSAADRAHLRKVEQLVLAIDTFEGYEEYVHGWKARPHQKALFEALQRLYDGTLTQDFPGRDASPVTKLLVLMWPGSGKSDTLIAYAAWYAGRERAAGRYPEIGFFSYSENVAVERASAVAEIWEYSDTYHEVFPEVLPDKKKGWAKTGWFLRRPEIGVKDPALNQAGFEGQVQSKRLNLAIIDDPHNIQEQLSPAKKAAAWMTYTQAIQTRGVGGHMKTVCVMTRLADDDLAGRILTEEAGEWAVVHLEALDEETEQSRWPLEFLPNGKPLGLDADYLLRVRKRDPRTFYTLYQARPPSERGDIFRTIYDDQPFPQPQDAVAVYQCWDTATTKKTTSDYTAMVEGVLLGSGKVVITNVIRLRAEFPEVKRAVLSEAKRAQERDWPGVQLRILVEARSSGQPVVQDLRETYPALPIREHTVNKPVDGSRRGNPDKVARANPAGVAMNDGRLVLVSGYAAWKEPYLYELRSFPNGRYDDQVDATTMLYEAALARPYMALPEMKIARNISSIHDRWEGAA